MVITYRELRLLELEVLRVLHRNQQVIGIGEIIWIDVDQFYGIEYDEWPARISEVALWLMDHQMNMRISEEFGEYFVRLPLKKSATIAHANALRTDWREVVPETEVNFILGNPPFYGKQLQTLDQKEDLKLLFNGVKGSGVLDYVAGWYYKATRYIEGSRIKVGFVSTNSIAQGEQTGILWNELFNNFGIKIHFAHRTFNWKNEAKGNAAVHVVIIGFANYDVKDKYLYTYENIKGEPTEIKVKNINPYLVEGKDLVVLKRRSPICNVSEITFGNMPNDGGNFLLNSEEKNELLKIEPKAKQVIKPILSAHEFLNGKERYCIWLKDVAPSTIRELKQIQIRVGNVKRLRSESSRIATRKLAAFPTLFGEIRQPKNDFILVPRHSSESRPYIPMGFFSPDSIVSDSCLAIDNASLYEFGILQSKMHMSWVKYTCGRIKSDYRYSNEMVYNNYPWPKEKSDKNKKNVEQKALVVLNIRTEFAKSSLADLYDPMAMPPKLLKAHQELDKVVDRCYRPQSFINETSRIEYLFDLFNEYSITLLSTDK